MERPDALHRVRPCAEPALPAIRSSAARQGGGRFAEEHRRGCAPRLGKRLGGCGGASRVPGGKCGAGNGGTDWEEEMRAFRKRTLKPNQLATLRQIEESKVDVGEVLACQDGVAIVEGLNNDAPNGTTLAFADGAAGVLAWRRSDSICFALILDRKPVTIGEEVKCNLKGIIQLVDESSGAATKREYDILSVPVGRGLIGNVVDFRGRARGTGEVVPSSNRVPLLNDQLDMQSREPICEPFFTGNKAVDALTPVGRGQCILLMGTSGSGHSSLAVDIILGQAGTDVACVYAAVGRSEEELQWAVGELKDHGAMEYTTVVAATDGACLAEQYATACAACSIAEQVRDAGGHALVILDTLEPMIELWMLVHKTLTQVGERAPSIIADDYKRQKGSAFGDEAADQSFDLVEYEGMLVSATAAQRRRFYGSLLQRSAKVSKSLGGGTLTLVPIVRGVPATGAAESRSVEEVEAYGTLSSDLKAKLLTAVTAQSSSSVQCAAPGDLGTEVIEELMSIADGQIVLLPPDKDSQSLLLDAKQSLSRIGSRAYPPVMAMLAPQIRFEMIQAADAQQYAVDPDDQLNRKMERHVAQLRAGFQQNPRQVASIEEQVVCLVAFEDGLLDEAEPSDVPSRLEELYKIARTSAHGVLEEIASTQKMTQKMRYELASVLTRGYRRD